MKATGMVEQQPGGQLSWVQRLGLIGMVIIGLGLAADLAFGAAMAGRIYPGIKVSGLDIGGRTRSQAMSLIRAQTNNYKLNLRVGDKSYTATTADLGAGFDPATTVGGAYLVGRGRTLSLLGLLDAHKSAQLAASYYIDRPALSAYITRVTEGVGQAAQDATVVVKAGVPGVQADKDGRAVEPERLIKLVEQSLADGWSTTIAIRPVARKADITASSLAPVVETTKQLMASSLTLTDGTRTFRPSASVIGGWLVYDKVGQLGNYHLVPRVDEARVKNYVQTIANQVNTAPVNQLVTVQNGVTHIDKLGIAGLALNQDAAVAAIDQALAKSVTLNYDLVTSPVAFKTITNQSIALEFGRYIEVSLSTQHLWVYQDHQVILDSPVTTGATGAGLSTATGLFSIYYKTTNTHLVGYQYGWNYDVPVQYWMPFYQGYGLHDAAWRNGSFGGPDYYYNGSHGCVNLPDSTAAFIYNWAEVGTPVWVHN